MASAYLDALRAAGANLVIASHVLALYFGMRDPYALGNLGVAVFFLLSGFLIMQSMLNWLNKPEPRLPGFIADRVARIMTPYVPALVLIALANVVLIEANHSLGGPNTGVLTFLGNLFLLQDHAVFQGLELRRHRCVAGAFAPTTPPSRSGPSPSKCGSTCPWDCFFSASMKREQIDRLLAAALLAIALPVVIWNAAAGGGKSLEPDLAARRDRGILVSSVARPTATRTSAPSAARWPVRRRRA